MQPFFDPDTFTVVERLEEEKVDYRRIWEEYYQLTVPNGWHIHHKDGNRKNNDPLNLICISAYVHWCIHFLQGHPRALDGKFIQGCSEAGKIGGRIGKRTGEIFTTEQRKKYGSKGGIKSGELRKTPFQTGIAGRSSVNSPNHNTKQPNHNSKQILTCSWCGKEGKGPTMYRHHFDNCPENPNRKPRKPKNLPFVL